MDFAARKILQDCAVFFALAAGYFATSKLGFTLAFQAEQVTAVWPPTGIALAAILLLGYRVWPAIALGAFLTNITANEPFAVAGAIAVGNTLEALTAVCLLKLFIFDPALGRTKDVLSLVFCAGIVATMISATIGVLSLCLGHVQPWENFQSLWLLWWVGDAAGALIVAPFILVWAQRPDMPLNVKSALEGCALAAVLVVASIGIFIEPSFTGVAGHAFLYVIFPLLIWAALRFGQRGATFVTLASCGIAIWATVHALGPFKMDSTAQSLLYLQSFMGIVAVTGLMLGAALTERKTIEKILQKNQELFRSLAAIVESSDDAIISKDLNGIIRSWNKGAEQLFGYSAAEAVGKPVTMLIPVDLHEEEKEILARISKGERIKHFETIRINKYKTPIHVSLSISPVRDEQGKIVRASKIVREITAQKKTEQA